MKQLHTRERVLLIAILLLTWMLRWYALMESPPGWRDDDLIELYTFSRRIAEQGPVLYFPGASGHEPLYHTLRAPVIALAGINQASARWVSASAGLLATALTWAVGRRLLGRAAGLTAAALTAVAFWSLMYSRVAIRHIGMLPWALVALYWGWRQLRDARPPGIRAVVGLGVGSGGALLTYYAGRLVPALLIAAYPVIEVERLLSRRLPGRPPSPPGPRRPWLRRILDQAWSRAREQHRLPGYALGLALGLLLAAPMFWTASHLPGADARVGELAVPLHALREGDPVPLLQTTWTTLGMFHAKGDPEWLYNVSERPVFGPVSATLFYLALVLTLVQVHKPERRLLLLWLAAGIAPAFISLPPSSLGHTILAMPAVYLILGSLTAELARRLNSTSRRWRVLAVLASLILVSLVGSRDLPDYFGAWTEAGMVRFLYRADYRALGEHLTSSTPSGAPSGTPGGGVAVGSLLFGPWDKVALATDTPGQAAAVRWLNPARALVFLNGGATPLYLQDEGERQPAIVALLASSPRIGAPQGMEGYRISPPPIPAGAITLDSDGRALAGRPLGEALRLDAVAWLPPATAGVPGWLATWWTVTAPLPLPPEQLIPNPPPPGVYNGPRLKVFAHLWDSAETPLSIDDGLWVDPYSLAVGDVVLHYHKFEGGEQVAAATRVTLGLYDPLTGVRWTTPDGADGLEITLGIMRSTPGSTRDVSPDS